MILRILLLVGAVAVTAPLHAETLSEPAPEAGPATNLSQHEVVEGDTLDAILSRAGIAAKRGGTGILGCLRSVNLDPRPNAEMARVGR